MTRAPHLRWRPLPGSLIDRRGAALALPILVGALSLPPTLASLPVLRETTRQAAIRP